MSLIYDLEYLKSLGFKNPSKFKYNGKTWSAWYHAKFDKYLIYSGSAIIFFVALAELFPRSHMQYGNKRGYIRLRRSGCPHPDIYINFLFYPLLISRGRLLSHHYYNI